MSMAGARPGHMTYYQLLSILEGTDADTDFNVEAALEVVATHEGGGRVLNDRYSLEEYVKRRGYYLGILHGHNARNTNSFSVARDDARLIFDLEFESLSVQEARRRELRFGIDPLLPLPTKQNTRTMDNFQSHPPTEWTPDVMSPPLEHDFQPYSNHELGFEASGRLQAIPATADAPPSVTAYASSTYQQPQTQFNTANGMVLSNLNPASSQHRFHMVPIQSYAQDVASAAIGVLSQKSADAADDSSRPSANNAKAAQQSQQTRDSEKPYKFPGLEQHLNPTSSNTSMVDEAPNQPGSLAAPGYPQGAEAYPQLGSATGKGDPKLIQAIIDALGKGIGAPAALAEPGDREATPSDAPSYPPLATVGEGISALSGRGINVPVKQKKKRAATPTPEPSTESDDEASQPQAEMTPPLAKRIKALKGSGKALGTNPPTKVRSSTSKPKKSATGKSKTNNYEAIIAGNALPKTRAEAKTAADDRHQRLLAAHIQDKKARKKRADEHPDLPPEFFSTQNFPAGVENDNQVRCVCDVKFDDGARMISCDTCTVWQHSACVGDALPKKNAQDARYDCQVCDPWVHRELIARLRREHPLGG